jgi:tetraacyldisaccharide 4'-kinase
VKILRIILFPIVPIYFSVTWLRNRLYDLGIKSSKSYNLPVICVGNLSTGGTGKTPMIEYLIHLLKDKKKIATLSRGYKRLSHGFVLADDNANTDTVGDEPFQFYRKFKKIHVAVDENRQHGIAELLALNPRPEVILLDDAFQHRKVNSGLNIMLTAFDSLFYKDMVLPTGNLRESRRGADRAQIIVVTKCPKDLRALKKNEILRRIKPKAHQTVFFSSINYASNVKSLNSEVELTNLSKFTLVTGIANAKPLVEFLHSKHLDFNHLEYGDHYSFKPSDIEFLEAKELIVTTEKDYVRLSEIESLRDKLYYLPIDLKIDKPEVFNRIITDYTD